MSMKEELIDKFKSRQAKALSDYVAKINGMENCRLQAEYDLLILGKEQPKKKHKKYFRDED